jgi:elongation factor Ts
MTTSMVQTEITPALVKDLRERTGAGFMACKRALEESSGDIDAAIALLREQGQAAAAGKAGREAREGQVASYIHAGGRLGVLIEVNCETDFVARTDDFQKLVRELAMQVAGFSARYPTIESVPADVVERKRASLLEDEATQSKPAEIREKIIAGQLAKWFKEIVLYEQAFRDTEQTVGQVVTESIARIGENIRVRRFVRFELGEEL